MVVKGAALKSPWAPWDAPWAAKPPEGKICPLCTPALCLNPPLTLTPTRTVILVLTLPLPLPLPLALHLALTPTPIKTEYWDRAGGVGNISYDW